MLPRRLDETLGPLPEQPAEIHRLGVLAMLAALLLGQGLPSVRVEVEHGPGGEACGRRQPRRPASWPSSSAMTAAARISIADQSATTKT